MFNLEEKITDWRKQMLATGIQAPVPLEELEIHLREEIERQMKFELNEAEAFNSAIQKIGQGKILKNEFGRAVGHHHMLMKILKRTLGIFAILIACYFVFGACFIFKWNVHYYYGNDVLPGTVFTVDGVEMNWFWIFLPVAVRLAIASAASWIGLKMLKRKYADV